MTHNESGHDKWQIRKDHFKECDCCVKQEKSDGVQEGVATPGVPVVASGNNLVLTQK